MAHPRALRRPVFAAAAGLALVGTVLLGGCAGSASSSTGTLSGSQLLTIPREDFSTFSRNFNPFSPNALPMTDQAIYEPMLVFNPADNKTTPWLASSWKVASDGRSITFTLRNGLTWSDGQALTAADVVYTFGLQKKLLGGYTYLAGVKALNAHTILFSFNKPYSPGLYDLGAQVIVPEHIWSTISNPSKYTNPDPVGSGPYTQVEDFTAQSYELKKNPHYWQPAKQHIAGVELLAFDGNDPANLATIAGQTDWADQYIPNIQSTFVDRDPKNRGYWFPPVGSLVNWTMNTTKAPFNDVNVRKALSMAIDRSTITKIGESGYATAADCTGLTGGYDAWRDSSVVSSCDWTDYNVAAANKLLDEAGYPRGANGIRKLKNGQPFSFTIEVGSTSSDWLSVANIISEELKAVGVEATVKAPNWSVVTSDYADGDYDTGIVWSDDDATPYQFYQGVMSPTTVEPVGTQTTDNYNRFGDSKADTLLNEFAASSTESGQKAAVDGLQELFSQDAPVVPLFDGPQWGAYNDTRFTGFPTAANPYATLSTRTATAVLVLTTLQPVVSH